MPIKPIDRQRLISDYLDAFRKANPDSKPPIISYSDRYYRFKNTRESAWDRKCRHRDLQRMLRALNGRAGGEAALTDD